MQPCREMPAFDSSQQIHNPQFDPNSATHDDFLEQIFSGLPSCSPWATVDPWDPPSSAAADHPPNASEPFHYDDHLLASKLRHHQINGSASPPAIKAMHHQQMIIAGLAHQSDVLNHQGGDATVQALFNGFGEGSLHGADTTSNQNLQHLAGAAPNFGASASVMNQAAVQPSGSTGGGVGAGGAPAQPKQRVRARRGQATDPHSIAERLRRERIADRMKALQELVPNANKTDKASMLDEIIDYVKFLQLQVKVLSMSRLGGAAAVAPLVADMSSEGGGGDCIQTSRNSNGNNPTASSNDSLKMTEHRVAKLMEEDMGSAMQYLQGKGLCLMPISLASAISTGTCQTRNTMMNGNAASIVAPVIQMNGLEGPSSPSMSVLTVQSATMGNKGGYDGSVKDTTSVSKP